MRVILWIASLLLILGIWGVGIEPRWVDIEREQANISNLPLAWEGKRVAVIADIQVGMWLANTSAVEEAVAIVREARPAAVLLAGDFVYHPLDEEKEEVQEDLDQKDYQDIEKQIDKFAELLQPLAQSDIPAFAVLGNHDYAMETQSAYKLEWAAEQVAQRLKRMGITVLHNQAVPLDSERKQPTGVRPFYLVGIGPHIPNEDDISSAFREVPADSPRLVFMHNPETFNKIPAGLAPIAIAGHTHGGQVRIPFLPKWSWTDLMNADPNVHVDGWVDADYGNGSNRLYVNRGIGMSRYPVRINCRPEVTLLTLKKGTTAEASQHSQVKGSVVFQDQ